MYPYRASHRYDQFVSLTELEYNEAFRLGSIIRQSSLDRGFTERKFGNGDGTEYQQDGAIYECVAAKFLDTFWLGNLDTLHNPDLVNCVEVRGLGQDWYGLRIRRRDVDLKRWVLGVIEVSGARKFRLPGWYKAEQVLQYPEWIIDPNEKEAPFWSVPQNQLSDPMELKYLMLQKRLEMCEKQKTKILHSDPYTQDLLDWLKS